MRRLFFSDASAIVIRSLVTFSDLLVDFTDLIEAAETHRGGKKTDPEHHRLMIIPAKQSGQSMFLFLKIQK